MGRRRPDDWPKSELLSNETQPRADQRFYLTKHCRDRSPCGRPPVRFRAPRCGPWQGSLFRRSSLLGTATDVSPSFESARSPEDEELERKKAVLAELEAQLADRELELASFQADLVHFERQYLQTVGRRYAVLDDLKAKIAEARARQSPQRADVLDQARQARARAQESARAVGEAGPEVPLLEDAVPPSRPDRSESLRNLYRQAAMLLHPDRTLDGGEKEKRRQLMAEANEAYRRGDEEWLRAILREWHTSPENVQGDGPGAELIRVIRMIAQVEKRLKAIAAEMEQLRQGELFKLKSQVEEARGNGRDILKDLCDRLDGEIARARDELERANNQEA